MPQKYRLLTHVKADRQYEQGAIHTEEELGSATLQSLLEHGSAEPYDPHAKAPQALASETAAAVRDGAIEELRGTVSAKDDEIRRLRAKLDQVTGKGASEGERRREKAGAKPKGAGEKAGEPGATGEGSGEKDS